MIAEPKPQDASRLPLASSRLALAALRLPLSAWLPLAVLGAYWLSLIHQLGAQWSIYEQYNYGWSVPFLCAYLIWRKTQGASRFPLPASRLALPASRSPLRASRLALRALRFPLPASRFPLSALSLLVLLAFLYAPTRWLHEANPVWRLTSLLWTLEVIGITFLVIHLLAEGNWQRPEAGSTPQQASNFHLPSALSLAFPICFFLVAVPWPYPLETFLVQTLMRLNVGATLELLGWLGVPAIQHGNVIEISTGAVGIDEACSGIRSMQATLMISLFLGELYALSVTRRVSCVFAGFALAFLFNVGRTLLLTQVGQTHGIRAIAAWHDPAGVTILVACFLCLWALAVLLAPPAPQSRSPAVSGPAPPALPLAPCAFGPAPPASRLPPPASRFAHSVVWSLAAWLVLVEGGTQLWYRLHERPTIATINWSLEIPRPSASYQTLDIPASIRSQFRYDAGLESEWQDPTGARWQLYYFRWLPTASLNRRVRVQRAKMHGPTTCLPMVGMTLKADLGITVIPIHSATPVAPTPQPQAVPLAQTILSASAAPTPPPQVQSAPTPSAPQRSHSDQSAPTPSAPQHSHSDQSAPSPSAPQHSHSDQSGVHDKSGIPLSLQPPTLNLAIHQYEFQAEGRLLHVFFGIYEDQTGSAVLANRRLDSLSRLQAAADGSRNSGQRFLEAAVWGYDHARDARAAFGRALEKLLKLQE